MMTKTQYRLGLPYLKCLKPEEFMIRDFCIDFINWEILVWKSKVWNAPKSETFLSFIHIRVQNFQFSDYGYSTHINIWP
jgi:hypothetical protein